MGKVTASRRERAPQCNVRKEGKVREVVWRDGYSYCRF